MLRLLREEKGAAVVLVAVTITAMMGFAALIVDVGNLYLNKTRLVNMADAAALAGVQELPGDPDGAIASTRRYAVQNGIDGDAVNVALSNNNTVVTVNVTRTVSFFFAQVLKKNSSNVAARAVAAIKPITEISGVVPFGVVNQEFVYGETYTLKDGAGDGYSGNYGALALGGNGANVYNGNIEEGYSGLLSIGDWVLTQPGNMSGPTGNGVEYRIGLDAEATYITVKKGSPRVMVVPIIESLDVNGKSQVKIVGFAAFFLEGVGGSGKDNYVIGTFMQKVTSGDSDTGTTGYGLYGAALIE